LSRAPKKYFASGLSRKAFFGTHESSFLIAKEEEAAGMGTGAGTGTGEGASGAGAATFSSLPKGTILSPSSSQMTSGIAIFLKIFFLSFGINARHPFQIAKTKNTHTRNLPR
jgi:hypothetical protein